MFFCSQVCVKTTKEVVLKCGWMVKTHHLMQNVHSLLLVMCMSVSVQNFGRMCCQTYTFEDFLVLISLIC